MKLSHILISFLSLLIFYFVASHYLKEVELKNQDYLKLQKLLINMENSSSFLQYYKDFQSLSPYIDTTLVDGELKEVEKSEIRNYISDEILNDNLITYNELNSILLKIRQMIADNYENNMGVHGILEVLKTK